MSRIVFLGTPEAAVPTLDALSDEHDVGLVVTQPDRPKGRSGRPTPPKIKEFAISTGLTVVQPGSAEALSGALQSHGPFDIGVVVAYGRILRSDVLAIPRQGMINVHFSLLPRWRGAAPVARALMAGDTMTGVTIIKLDEGLDTGPVLTAQALDIDLDVDLGTLTERLAKMGASLLIRALPEFLDGVLRPVEQSDDGMTYAAKVTSEDRSLSVEATPEVFLNHVRGLSPRPGAVIDIDGRPHKILQATTSSHHVKAGSWVSTDGAVVIGVKGGAIEVVLLQPPGKTPQLGPDWARGRRINTGRVGLS
jgi:methionyl-tRNA formyltransferase